MSNCTHMVKTPQMVRIGQRLGRIDLTQLDRTALSQDSILPVSQG